MSNYNEPWIPDGCCVYDCTDHRKVAHVDTGLGLEADDRYAARIIACVNACRRISDQQLAAINADGGIATEFDGRSAKYRLFQDLLQPDDSAVSGTGAKPRGIFTYADGPKKGQEMRDA